MTSVIFSAQNSVFVYTICAITCAYHLYDEFIEETGKNGQVECEIIRTDAKSCPSVTMTEIVRNQEEYKQFVDTMRRIAE